MSDTQVKEFLKGLVKAQNLMLQWDLKNAEHERMRQNLSRVHLETRRVELQDMTEWGSVRATLTFLFFSVMAVEKLKCRYVETACMCVWKSYFTMLFKGFHLTRSAYFLHKAANFSSGVAREFRACINRTTSFPEAHKKTRKDRLTLYNIISSSTVGMWRSSLNQSYPQVVLELMEEGLYQCIFVVFFKELLFCNNLILRM